MTSWGANKCRINQRTFVLCKFIVSRALEHLRELHQFERLQKRGVNLLVCGLLDIEEHVDHFDQVEHGRVGDVFALNSVGLNTHKIEQSNDMLVICYCKMIFYYRTIELVATMNKLLSDEERKGIEKQFSYNVRHTTDEYNQRSRNHATRYCALISYSIRNATACHCCDTNA